MTCRPHQANALTSTQVGTLTTTVLNNLTDHADRGAHDAPRSRA